MIHRRHLWEAMNGLKEYAKVNGGFITKDDVLSYFKDLDLDDGKLQMVYGYLMANNIKIKGAASEDNEFLKMMETAEAEEIQKQEAEETKQEEQAGAKQLEESLDYAEDEKYFTAVSGRFKAGGYAFRYQSCISVNEYC